MYKDKVNSKIGIIITAIILIALVIFSNLNNDIISKIINPFTKITMAAQSGITQLKSKITGDNEYFVSLDNLKAQYEDLKNENERLSNENKELVVLKAENTNLKKQLDLAENYKSYEIVSGYVIQKDFSNYSKTIVINLGKNDGIETGMTVIAEKGLVGHIVSVEDTSSKVQTIVDTASVESCLISNSEKTLVARGLLDSNQLIKGYYIDNDVVVNEGDTIYTSGLGGIYSPNITIGKVKQIVNTQNKTNRYVYIETAVNFENLNNISVIKNNK